MKRSAKPQRVKLAARRPAWSSIPRELGRPVAMCRGEWQISVASLSYSVDSFFVWRTERFEPSTAGMGATGAGEKSHVAWRWWTIEELYTTNEAACLARLGDVVRLIMQG